MKLSQIVVKFNMMSFFPYIMAPNSFLKFCQLWRLHLYIKIGFYFILYLIIPTRISKQNATIFFVQTIETALQSYIIIHYITHCGNDTMKPWQRLLFCMIFCFYYGRQLPYHIWSF